MAATPAELAAYLKSLVTGDIGMLDRVKTVYRPYICPLDDLLNLLPKGASIFDIGCGNGSFLALAASFRKSDKLGGIEISETLVRNARELITKAAPHATTRIHVYDGKSIPEISGFQFVFMIDVFHHIPVAVRKDILEQVYQKMSVGSSFIMKDINAASPLVYANKLHDLAAAGEIGNEISLEAMRAQLQEAGFTITSTSKKTMLWYPHYTLVCRK